jgi:hypothetical protein
MIVRIVRVGAVAGVAAAAGALAWRDRRNTDQPIRAKYPIAYWGRRVATELGPLLRQYWFVEDEDERPYNRVTKD